MSKEDGEMTCMWSVTWHTFICQCYISLVSQWYTSDVQKNAMYSTFSVCLISLLEDHNYLCRCKIDYDVFGCCRV